MIYYTQLIFVKPGKEAEFNSFEEKVLPLLNDHQGELIYRIRPARESFIANPQESPYEIHLVSFESRAGFDSYASDPRRQAFLDLKNNSVEKIILIEGKQL
ncbi:MAG TPA: hypothetical protein VFE53_24555 [Mucilaginibacter sp.]|jgi:hypothetical protein|nr:hypothetical protein [Mucilaginibacter sp.]